MLNVSVIVDRACNQAMATVRAGDNSIYFIRLFLRKGICNPYPD